VTGGEITLSDDGTGTDKADARDHALQDICIHDGHGSEHDIAVCTRAQLAIAAKGNVRKPAPRSSRAVPSNRQGGQVRDQQVNEVVEAVGPNTENARHQFRIRR
jgi:hypothetical protein